MAKTTEQLVSPSGGLDGLSVRQWFAGLCMQGILLGYSNANIQDAKTRAAYLRENALLAVEQADALIAALEQTRK